jgi:uncharacterized protein (DUF1501 family)
MKRRDFLKITATSATGMLLVPNFLHASVWNMGDLNLTDNILVFIQLNGGNDGLNTIIPYTDPVYYGLRPSIGISKNEVINASNGMGFHPALKDLAKISQEGHLSIIQNVGYPNPNRSHFRSQEILQTASNSNEYFDNGWLGRFLDIHCNDESLAAINIDSIDNLALKSSHLNSLTIKDFNRIGNNITENEDLILSENPQLDFVRKLAYASTEGMEEIQKALQVSKHFDESYANNGLSKNLQWVAKLIKGNLSSKVYYTSLNGFDTHNNQLQSHNKQLTILNDALFSFYNDLKKNNLIDRVTTIVFSEFGRRVKENGTGTDHGTAGPMFIMGGKNQGKIIGKNPNLVNLDNGDLIYDIDFRSVYATLLKNKFQFDPTKIKINQSTLDSIF